MIDWDVLKAANEPLNAFLDFDESAEAGDGPLGEMTAGIKVNIATGGLPWTAGMELFRNRVAERDAETVAKLREAGAAIIGSLNMEEAAIGAKTDNPFFGRTQNPHRIGYTPGGSSGGSGAAVAAGLCDIALGTDTMGSVRIPAAYCGVYGFKPANASVSQDGFELAEASLDCIGPLARSLDVLEKAARVISDFGENSYGGTTTLAELGGVECEAAVVEAYSAARGALNCDNEFDLPHKATRIRFAGFIKVMKAMTAQFGDAEESLISVHLRGLMVYGENRKADDWQEDQQVLADTAEALQAATTDGTVILLPTAPQAAFPFENDAPANQADFTCLANIAALPAISIPAGRDPNGLPVAVQLVGAPGREAGLFDMARKLDSSLDGYAPPNPSY